MIETLREIALPIGIGLFVGVCASGFLLLCYMAIKLWERRC